MLQLLEDSNPFGKAMISEIYPLKEGIIECR